MNRYLIISDEISSDIKPARLTHFDIIPAKDIDHAVIILKKHRPKIIHFTHLSHLEIESIHHAMVVKSNRTLMKNFKRNIKEKR